MKTTIGDATLHTGCCIDVLAELPEQSVNTCITSPPYFGLRDYGNDGQIGLEETPDAYVAKMVEVFRAVRRVLRDDGTVWLNLGDSYSSFKDQSVRQQTLAGKSRDEPHSGKAANRNGTMLAKQGLKNKDLIGIPWRVALALQADGWYLRQDIIWAKPNPMPESVTDRCTKAHEYIFLLTKNAKYYYDQEAIREPIKHNCDGTIRAIARTADGALGGENQHNIEERIYNEVKGANRRSVWTVTTKPYAGAHFATFPPDLIEPCVMAGCPSGGVVLDPFSGSATTGQVALQQGRKYIGIELNQEYQELAIERITPHAKQGRLFA